MNIARQYSIAYKGLSQGEHTFDFEIGDDLFRHFENTEIEGGRCKATVRLRRAEGQLRIDVSIRGEAIVICDRCLEECPLPVDFNGELVVKFSDEIQEYDGETMWLSPAEDFVDLSQYLYESIVLSLPYQRVHPEGGCDPDMLNRFRIVSEEEFGHMEEEAEKKSAAEAPNEAWTRQLAALKEQMEREEETEKH